MIALLIRGARGVAIVGSGAASWKLTTSYPLAGMALTYLRDWPDRHLASLADLLNGLWLANDGGGYSAASYLSLTGSSSNNNNN